MTRAKKFSPQQIEKFLYSDGGCCKGRRGTCSTLKAIPRHQVHQKRTFLQNTDKAARRVWIRSMVQNAKDRSTGRMKHFQVNGYQLCIKAFCEVYNISPRTLNNHSSIEVPVQTHTYTPRVCPVSQPAIQWLKMRIPEIADQSPKNQTFVMPQATMNKEELLRMYIYENGLKESGAPMSCTTWYRLLKVRE